MHAINYIEAKIPGQEFRCGWKLNEEQQAVLWQLCQQSPVLPNNSVNVIFTSNQLGVLNRRCQRCLIF